MGRIEEIEYYDIYKIVDAIESPWQHNGMTREGTFAGSGIVVSCLIALILPKDTAGDSAGIRPHNNYITKPQRNPGHTPGSFPLQLPPLRTLQYSSSPHSIAT